MNRWTTCVFALVLALAGACTASNPGDDDDTATSPTPEPSAPPQGTQAGCRDIALSTGVDGLDDDASAYYTSAIGNSVDTSEFLGAQGWQTSGPLTVCGGEIVDGEADLTLQNDVTVAISLPLDTCLCRDYLASGTAGTLYCKASSAPLDFTLSVNSNAASASDAPQLSDGAGASGEGDVRLTFSSRATTIDAAAASCTPSACQAALASVTPETAVYTTGTAGAEFTNTVQGGDVLIEATGMRFDDDPDDGVADCEDWEAGTGAGALAGAPGHDEDNDALGLQDVVTIERIAEVP